MLRPQTHINLSPNYDGLRKCFILEIRLPKVQPVSLFDMQYLLILFHERPHPYPKVYRQYALRAPQLKRLHKLHAVGQFPLPHLAECSGMQKDRSEELQIPKEWSDFHIPLKISIIRFLSKQQQIYQKHYPQEQQADTSPNYPSVKYHLFLAIRLPNKTRQVNY